MTTVTFRKNPELLVPLTVGFSTLCFGLGKHMMPQWNVGMFHEAKRGGKPRGFTEQIEEMILDELQLFEQQPGKNLMEHQFTSWRGPLTEKYRFIVVDDLRGVTVGTPRFLYAFFCYVGLPCNIFYNSIEDVAADCDNLKLTGASSASSWWRWLFGERGRLQKIKWGSEAGVKLMESLVLSHDAKRFLTQRLIQEADVFNTPAVDALAYAVPLGLAGLFNYAFKIFYSKRSGRFARNPVLWPIYLCTTIPALFVGDSVKRWCQNYADMKADKLTALIGDTYIGGGIEYYEKILQRNRSINELLQRDGLTRVYDTDGDYIERRFRKAHTSIKKRLQQLIRMAEEAKEKKS